jgi:hypothetical protein
MQALIAELLFEHLANKSRERDEAAAKKRETDESAEGRAYRAARKHFLECRKEVATLQEHLEKIEGTHQEPDSTRATLREQLTEAEARYTQAKEAFDRLSWEPCTEQFCILQLAKSEPYTHGLDPYSLVVFHPWRAIASGVLAWLVSLILIPHRREPEPESGLARPAQA